ncbi:hypothetical protein GCM10027290_08290 [Micromonospora sonneratiae]|uniref:Uncharacterized protein n=1 Tax=Micromonospora sonneratiae TaxID=1184706 RepID=A0ABW3YEY4_9ACTN
MRVRRGVARLAVVFALLTGLLAVGAAPAAADDDKVKVKIPGSFVAGTPAAVTVTASRRDGGCVQVRFRLAIMLPGLSADQVRVEVPADGQWIPVGMSGGGDGALVSEPAAPSRPELCKRKSVSLRFRVTFLPGAPSGEATVIGEAADDGGDTLDRDDDNARVISRAVRTPTPTPTESPSPTPEETQEAVAPTGSPAAAAPKQDDDGGLGVGTIAMLFGVVMVGIGIALLTVLLRRGRGDREERDLAPAGPSPGGYPGRPRQPGTVYPSQSGTVYPSQPGAGHPPQPGPGFPPPPAASGGGDATAIMPRLPR